MSKQSLGSGDLDKILQEAAVLEGLGPSQRQQMVRSEKRGQGHPPDQSKQNDSKVFTTEIRCPEVCSNHIFLLRFYSAILNEA